MTRAIPPKTPRMLLATTTLLALLIGLAATLTQCNRVTDELTGTRVAATEESSNCIKVCARAYRDSSRVEEALHESNERACRENRRCRELEEARHEAAEKRIKRGRKNCQNHCHHQGGGHGGDD